MVRSQMKLRFQFTVPSCRLTVLSFAFTSVEMGKDLFRTIQCSILFWYKIMVVEGGVKKKKETSCETWFPVAGFQLPVDSSPLIVFQVSTSFDVGIRLFKSFCLDLTGSFPVRGPAFI